ncbi:MAG: hypothetical protein NVSMB58_37940 [Terriglobales bacterium]
MNWGFLPKGSKSDEVLDFKKYAREGVGLTALVVGGLSLSRGLTIEGLCVSYMYGSTWCDSMAANSIPLRHGIAPRVVIVTRTVSYRTNVISFER